jgi:hypothetical protein
MSEKLGQESAFPFEYINTYGTMQSIEGMSKRFYAACAAMQGLFAAGAFNVFEDTSKMIKCAYKHADELLLQESL